MADLVISRHYRFTPISTILLSRAKLYIVRAYCGRWLVCCLHVVS